MKTAPMKSTDRQTADVILRSMAAHWSEAVTPITHLMMRVYRLSSLVLDNAMSQVAAYGLTFTEFEVLAALRSMAPPHELVPTELYRAVLMSSGGLTKVLYALQEKGLVARSAGGRDKRSKPVRLTAKGRTLIERVMADVLSSDGALISSGLSDGEIAQLTKLLRKLLATLEPEAP